VEKTVTGT